MVNTAVCTFCDSEQLKLIADTVRFDQKADIYKCLKCGLTFLDQNSFKFSQDFYQSDYHQTYLTHIEPDAVDPQKYYTKMKKATQIWADKLVPSLTGKEVVLDVGCSSGHFMDLIKDHVQSIHGSELNQKEIQFCREQLNLDVSDEPLEKRFDPETFDLITMIFVLEHIAQPKEFLNHLKKFLKPDGKLVVLVPNIKDALVNFYDIPEFQKFYYCIEHLYYYDQQTIQRLFDESGLLGSIDIVQEYPLTNHLNWAYTREPSDVLSSRRGVPNIDLGDHVLSGAWEDLWNEFNQKYQQFLTNNGYGDRLWCEVKKNAAS